MRQHHTFSRMHTLCSGDIGRAFSQIVRFSVGLLVLSISLCDMLLQGNRSSDDEPAPSMSLAVSRMTSKMEKQRQRSNAMWRAHMARVIVQLPVHPHLHLYLRFCSDMVSVIWTTAGYLSVGPMAQCVVHALSSQKHIFQWLRNLGTRRFLI